MNSSRNISGIVIIGIVATMLFIPQGIGTPTFADDRAGTHFPNLALPSDPNYVEDTIGDIKIRGVFHFNLMGTETVNSFRIFNQMGGYKQQEFVQFQLLGGVGGDKIRLYTATDMTNNHQHTDPGQAYTKFDVDVYLFKRGQDIAYRHMEYNDCKVSDYQVTTLHDGDETFSGKTKFVIADAFTFDCKGFLSHCPFCIFISEQKYRGQGTESSTNIDTSQLPTWEEHPKFQNR